jgi:radical SAM superfamily enzyme YgiQ (UPF0313 family)
MVAAVLRARGHEVSLLRGEAFLRKTTIASDFDACFISGMSMDLRSVSAVASAWKRVNPSSPVIAGGPLALDPVAVFRNSSAIDAIIPGEAERGLFDALELGQSIDLSTSIPAGFVTMDNLDDYRAPTFSSADWPETDFIEKEIPPAIDLLSSYDNAWAAKVYIECLRGCSNFTRARVGSHGERACIECGYCDTAGEFSIDHPCPVGTPPGCGFCSVPAVSGPIRSFSEAYIVDQVAKCIEMGCHRVVLGGSDFMEYQREKLFDPGHTRPIAPPPPNHDAIESLVNRLLEFEAVQTGNVQLFIENVKASLCDDEAVAAISRLPDISLSVGVETGADSHLVDIGKATTVEQIKQAVGLFNKHGVRYHAYFVHSLPGQTPERVHDSMKLIRWLETERCEKITIYRFKPLPVSTFQGFRVTKQFIDDAQPLIDEAIRVNEENKKHYVSLTCKVLIAEKDFRDRSAAVAYMLRGGPKVKITGAASLVNDKKVHVAKITRVISDKMTEGVLVE